MNEDVRASKNASDNLNTQEHIKKDSLSLPIFPRAQSVSGHVARSPWIHLALKREISCVSSQ